MISTVILISSFVVITSSALEFHPPIHIIRPIDDVHEHCSQYVEQFCSTSRTTNNGNSHFQGGVDHQTTPLTPTSTASYENDDGITRAMALMGDNADTIADEQKLDNVIADCSGLGDWEKEQKQQQQRHQQQGRKLKKVPLTPMALMGYNGDTITGSDRARWNNNDSDSTRPGLDEIEKSDTMEQKQQHQQHQQHQQQGSKPKKASISVNIRINPKNKESSESGGVSSPQTLPRAKDTKHPLNYGSTTDTCLWHAFNAGLVLPSQCASALQYINESVGSKVFTYGSTGSGGDDNGGSTVVTQLSISFLVRVLVWFGEICYFLGLLYHWCANDGDDDDDDDADDDRLDLEHDYQFLDESNNSAFVTMPVRIV